jgi:hypothetical protein
VVGWVWKDGFESRKLETKDIVDEIVKNNCMGEFYEGLPATSRLDWYCAMRLGSCFEWRKFDMINGGRRAQRAKER